MDDKRVGIRSAVMSLYDVMMMAKLLPPPTRDLRKLSRELRRYLEWSSDLWSRKRRIPMDVTHMINEWTNLIFILSTVHGKETLDTAEYSIDELLAPLLTAPVKQLRAFYHGLTKALEEDPRIPFFVWSMFSAWGEITVKDAPDEDVIQLKEQLAREIAQLVERDIHPHIMDAITGALKWRDVHALREVKANLQKGVKPTLKGRESCLFLEVGDATVML